MVVHRLQEGRYNITIFWITLVSHFCFQDLQVPQCLPVWTPDFTWRGKQQDHHVHDSVWQAQIQKNSHEHHVSTRSVSSQNGAVTGRSRRLYRDHGYYERTPEEHDDQLKNVLRKIEASGLKLNKERCNFWTTQLTYFSLLVGSCNRLSSVWSVVNKGAVQQSHIFYIHKIWCEIKLYTCMGWAA